MEKFRGYLYALTSAVLLGAMAILIKIVMDMGLSVSGAIFFRFTFASFILALFLKIKGISLRVRKKQLLFLLVTAVFGYGLMNLCYYGAFQYISVGLTCMIHYIYPGVSVLLAVVLYKHSFSRNIYIALGLAVVGAMVLSFSDIGHIDLWGVALALMAGVCYGTYAALMEHPVIEDLHGTVIVFYISVITALFGLCLSPFYGEAPWGSANMEILGIMVFISLFCTVIAMFLFREAVVYIGSARTTILSTMEPVSAALFGIAFLGERIDLGMIVGSILIISAVIKITLERKKRTP